MLKDTQFYNSESSIYSGTRYLLKPKSYVQFLYKNRYVIIGKLFDSHFNDKNIKSILEVGCADGVVSELISKKFPNAKIVSTDISAGMIDVAKQRKLENVSFFLRGEEPEEKYDLVIYLGVFNLMDLEYELNYIKNHLNENGSVLLSFAAKESLMNLFRPFKTLFNHLLSLKKYNENFSNLYDVNYKSAHGLFIPFLWKLPYAEKIQNLIENIIKKISYLPFHEQIYILKLKNNK